MKNVIAGLEEGLGAIATAIEGDGYPKPTNVPQGKVLTADGDDGASWEDAPSGLPTINGSDKVLITAYDSQDDEYYARWTSDWGQMPPHEYANVGDVITIDPYGNPVWQAPSGGGSGQSATFEKTDATYDDKAGVYFWRIPTIEYASVIAANVISLIEYSGYISELSGIKQINDFNVSDYGSGSGISISVSSTVYSNISGGTLKFGIA